jgi:L-ascorbate metabolism protein UlaG (beta-lactamase superfamily)
MTGEEAAESTKRFKLKVVIPIHYGSIVGDDGDVERFNRQTSREVEYSQKSNLGG